MEKCEAARIDAPWQAEGEIVSSPYDSESGVYSQTLTFNPSGYVCVICDTLLEEIHCKLNCPNCGAMRDCSDP